MRLKLITGPASEPVTLIEAKAHLRVVSTSDDAYITALIVAARQGAEHITGRALMPQTWELALDEFRSLIVLPKPPFVAVDSVKYVDGDGVLQTLDPASYLVDDYNEPARLMPAYAESWPYARNQANAVLIRFRAGYSSLETVPEQIKAWMLLRIGTLYANRESVAVGVSVASLPDVDRLLDEYRVWGYK